MDVVWGRMDRVNKIRFNVNRDGLDFRGVDGLQSEKIQ